MGYESKVVINCTKDVLKDYKKMFEKHGFYPDKTYIHNDKVVFYWNWCKWYDWFDEVKDIMELTDKLIQKDDKNVFGFSRIGEEIDDAEEYGSYYGGHLYIDIKVDRDFKEVNFNEI